MMRWSDLTTHYTLLDTHRQAVLQALQDVAMDELDHAQKKRSAAHAAADAIRPLTLALQVCMDDEVDLMDLSQTLGHWLTLPEQQILPVSWEDMIGEPLDMDGVARCLAIIQVIAACGQAVEEEEA